MAVVVVVVMVALVPAFLLFANADALQCRVARCFRFVFKMMNEVMFSRGTSVHSSRHDRQQLGATIRGEGRWLVLTHIFPAAWWWSPFLPVLICLLMLPFYYYFRSFAHEERESLSLFCPSTVSKNWWKNFVEDKLIN